MRNLIPILFVFVSISCFGQQGVLIKSSSRVYPLETPSFTPVTIQLIFGTNSPPTNWNRIQNTTTVSSLLDSTGATTSADVTLSQQTAVRTNSAGGYCSSPTYLSNAMYLQSSEGTNGRTLSFTGLTDGTYAVEYMGSRDATSTLNNSITISGNTSSTHNIIDNCGNYSMLASVTVSGGTMTITFNSTGSVYINTIKVRRTA